MKDVELGLFFQVSTSMIARHVTKITNLGALKIVLGLKNFALYLAYSIVFAFGSGLLVDFVI